MGRKRKILFEDITYDRIGEPVNMDKCPECAEHPDCFACIEGKCTALSECGGQGCVFYKPEQQAIQEALRAYQMLKGKKRYDLIQKYIKAFTALGAKDGLRQWQSGQGIALRPLSPYRQHGNRVGGASAVRRTS